MAIKCLICKAASKKGKNRSFHRFPKCMERRRKWVKALAIENLPRNTFVCSDHFTPGDFTTKPSGVLWLRKEAVPRPLTNLPVIETRHTLESFPQGKRDTKPYSQAYNFPHTFAQSEFNPFAPRELSEENIDTGSVKIEDVEITEDFPGPSSPNSSTSTLTANSPMSVGPEELRVIPSPLPNQNIDTGSMKIEDVEITEDFPGPNSPNSSTSTLTANSPMSVGPEEELRVIPSPPPNQNTKNIILIEIIDNSDKTQCVSGSSSRILPSKCLISSDGSVGLISTPLPKKKTYRMLLPKPSISVESVGSISTLLPEEQSSSRMCPKSTISSVESVGSTSTPLPEERSCSKMSFPKPTISSIGSVGSISTPLPEERRCSKMSFPKPTISSIGSVGSISTPLPEERRCSKMLFPEPTISSVESVGSTSTPLPEEREKRKAIRILRYFGDSHIEDMNNPVLARQFYNFTKKTIENQQGKIKHLKRSNRILKKQVCNLQIAVNYLTDKNKLLENKF